MSRYFRSTVGVAVMLAAAACSKPAGTLDAAVSALKTNDVKSIEYSGTGKWFQFGQPPNPNQPWPQFDVSAYTAAINFEAPAARVQMTRKQTVDPQRVRATPVDQRSDQYVSGTVAWNLAAPAGAPTGTAPAAIGSVSRIVVRDSTARDSKASQAKCWSSAEGP